MYDPSDVAKSLTFTSIGDALIPAMHENIPLKRRGGLARTIFDMGREMLRQRVAGLQLSDLELQTVEKRGEAQLEKGLPLCESPIECMMLAALLTTGWGGFLTVPPIVHDPKKDGELPKGDIIIIPQMAFLRFRVDFGIIMEIKGHRRILAVECDGEEFHGDAMRERNRDGYLKSWDIPTVHFMGSEIHRDALACGAKAAMAVFENWLSLDALKRTAAA